MLTDATYLHADAAFPLTLASASTDRTRRLEVKIDRLTDALAQKFEEIRLIHDLTQRLSLDQAIEQLCQELMESLRHCISTSTLAIELDADVDSDFAGHTLQLGEKLDWERVRGLARAAWEQATGAWEQATGAWEQATGAWEQATGASCSAGCSEGTDLDRVAIVNASVHRLIGSRRIIVLPIWGKSTQLGQLIALRSEQDPEFGSSEVELLRSVLMIVGVHLINQRQYREVQRMFEGSVQSLVSALDAKDAYTGGHSSRVAELAAELAIRLGYHDADVKRIRMAGNLHDIGKIGVQDSVLLKPGQLTEAEFDQIRQHPVYGYEILKGIHLFQSILPAVRHHHESWDGRGYPDGLQGDSIPRDAQVLAVADAFDAMISDRPYRKGMSLEKVTEILRCGRAKQWAADVVDVLLASPELLKEYSDRGATEDSAFCSRRLGERPGVVDCDR